jgi:hypothetical protein
MTWVGYVAWTGDMRNMYKILVKEPEGRDRSEDLGVVG